MTERNLEQLIVETLLAVSDVRAMVGRTELTQEQDREYMARLDTIVGDLCTALKHARNKDENDPIGYT